MLVILEFLNMFHSLSLHTILLTLCSFLELHCNYMLHLSKISIPQNQDSANPSHSHSKTSKNKPK